MNKYYTADTHFGKPRASRFRTEFLDKEEHDSIIMDNLLSVSGKRNWLHLLGDTFFEKEEFKKLDTLAGAFQKIIIVGGNHCHEDLATYAARFNNVRFVGCFLNHGVWYTHIPVHADNLRGRLNVHGHIHNNTVDDPRYLCVSLEQTDYRPVSDQWVKQIFHDRFTELSNKYSV